MEIHIGCSESVSNFIFFEWAWFTRFWKWTSIALFHSVCFFTEAHGLFLHNTRHTNIVNFLGCCLEPNRVGLVLEYCHRGTLKHLLRTHAGNIPWSTKISMLLDVAKGVHFLHSKNIIHRDLKTDNVLVSYALFQDMFWMMIRWTRTMYAKWVILESVVFGNMISFKWCVFSCKISQFFIRQNLLELRFTWHRFVL